MKKILYNPAQIITVNTNGRNFLRGGEFISFEVFTEHSVIIEGSFIKDIVPSNKINNKSEYQIIDLSNKVLLPGFIDCHTHAVFAGTRRNEFKMKLEGATYEQLAEAGMGINSTVKAVEESTVEDLVAIASSKIKYFIRQGVTSIEIKSGYGLSFDNEIKILQAIKKLKEIYSIDIISTFLGAHTYPLEYKNNRTKYIDIICNEMLPYVKENGLAEFCDAFCESTAFHPDEIRTIFSKAKELGYKIKLHTDQFNSIGGVDVGLDFNALSLEHLEVINDKDLAKLNATETVSVLLPGVSFFLDYGYAPARKLLDQGSIVALSTDYNPGSSHIQNISLIMFLAARKMKMNINEIISAFTINAAKALDIHTQTGSIEINKKVDFAVLNTSNYFDIIYDCGMNLNCMTIKNGEIIYSNKEIKF
ncbi:MAG TPA: imidazolonepropionase [Ignavibacteriaceae bacterium]|nr:imidazolonepropionase [Ignavibacteriaceae bacterium]